jgi:hypothetical protein
MTPPEHIVSTEHIDSFMGLTVTPFDPKSGLRELDRNAYAVGVTFDDDDDAFEKQVDALLADRKIGQLRALVVRSWFTQVCEGPPTRLTEQLIGAANKLRSLRGLFVGEIIQEECEISWLKQTDYTPLLRALPDLEVFMVRGGDELRFVGLTHDKLQSLTVQTGGLSAAATRDIASASLPALRELTVWLGSDDYGGNSSVGDLAALLAGGRFPHLTHLGLQDSEYADDIAAAVAKSPLLAQLESLDLSMGNLTDVGGQTLLDSTGIRRLKHLNLRYHYLSNGMMQKLQKLGVTVDVSDQQEPEDYGDDEVSRFVEVAE